MDQGFPKFELEQILRSDAADILAAREKARIMHHGKDIRAAGDEIEMAFRKVLRRKLASSYYIGHGHIVDQELHTSPQLDVIIADNAGSPVLFQAEDGSEYFPYEGVYAIGEVKSSYEKSKQYIHKFAKQLTKMHTQLVREEPERHFGVDLSDTYKPDPFRPDSSAFAGFKPVANWGYRNPLFSFMFFADAGDFRIEDVIDLYRTQPTRELPNIVCLLNKGVIVNAVTHVDEDSALFRSTRLGEIKAIPERNIKHQSIRYQWILLERRNADQQLAANFGALYHMLATHLKECQLTTPNLIAYIEQLFDQPIPTIIV